MSEFDAIDSLLASLIPQEELPDTDVRRSLRCRHGSTRGR